MAGLTPGAEFGRYRIESIAGQGGMGVVYRATQLGLDRTVALKVIAPQFAGDEEFRARFQRESKLAASIEHPNVIPVYEAGEQDGTLFLAMRFVDGTDVKSLLMREGRLEPLRAARFVNQIAAALDAAHAAGLVHRDVKPANALLAAQDHVYLTDFGLTKRAASGSAMTKTGQMVGTVDYVAPEQVEGSSVDARTDVYSLACVLYHLLTGRVPFDKPTEMAKLFAHVHEDPPAPSDSAPGAPAELDEVVRRGMAKDPSERFLSAGDLGRAALAGAEHRAMAAPERSVARGEAAPAEVAALAAAATELRTAPPVAADRAGAAGAPEVAPGAHGATATGRPRNLKLWAAGAAVVVIAGVAAAFLTGGGNGGDSTSSGDSGTVVQVTRANALDSASTYADGVNETNISNFEDLYKGDSFSEARDLPTCSDADQPMNTDVALAEWQCLFEQFQSSETNLSMKLSGQRVDLGKKTLTAAYTLTGNGEEMASGKVAFHLIPGVDFPRMDKVTYLDGKGTFVPASSASSAGGAGSGTLTRAQGLGIVATWADYWTDENLGGLEEIFGAPGFTMTVTGEICSGAKSPMNLDATLAEFDCNFQELTLPEVKTSNVLVKPAAKTAAGEWALTDDGSAVTSGTFEMHLVPQGEDQQPKIDKLELKQK